ncbi:MAG TPA: hypothetical protein VFP32_03590 [Candidatus Saccharimonadales bacterium]|nr:hypothetical protein [Candidatus Saccharimonadales bacterium]
MKTILRILKGGNNDSPMQEFLKDKKPNPKLWNEMLKEIKS